MGLTDFKVITLGCYGTLIDKASGVYAALRPLLSRASVNLSRDEVLASFTDRESALAAETPGMLYSDILIEAHRRLAKQWYVIASDDDHRLFGMSVPDWPVFADTPAALQYLKRYFKLVILSNIDRESFAGSNRKLGVKFDAILTAQDIGSYKPNPGNFDYMLVKLEKLGLVQRQILHAAESLDKDIKPAAARGLATAWIDRRREKTGRNATLRSADVARCNFRFSSMADLVITHQEHLRA